MCDEKRLPKELLRIEQGLSALSPTSTLSRDEVIFAAGRASAERTAVDTDMVPTVTPATVSPMWRVATSCLAVLSVVLTAALMQQPDVDSTPTAARPTPVAIENSTVAANETELPASNDLPAVATANSTTALDRASRQQTISLRTLMDSIGEFRSQRDLAMHLNGQANYRVNPRPLPDPRARSGPAANAPTRSQLLQEFLPSPGKKNQSVTWP